MSSTALLPKSKRVGPSTTTYSLIAVNALIGAPAFPVTVTFPWLGPAGFIALPVKFRLRFGAPLQFEGALDGDEITGRLGPLGEIAESDPVLSLRRRAASLTGVWEISAGGETFVPQWLMRIGRDGARWTAARRTLDTVGHAESVTALPGSPPPVSEALQGRERRMTDFYVWGASIYFVVGGGEGDAPRVIYRGLVDGDRIAGTVHNGGRMTPWVARRSPEPR